MVAPNPLDVVAMFASAIAESASWGEVYDIRSWIQVWSDTSCGHGGLAGQACTLGFVVAVYVSTGTGEAIRFYSNGRLLHNMPVDDESEGFVKSCHVSSKRGMVG